MQIELKHPLTKVLATVIAQTVYHENDLQFRELERGGELSIIALPHMADYGILIGQSGRTVNGFRQVCRSAEKVFLKKFRFNIQESFVGKKEPKRDFDDNPNFAADKLLRLFNDLVAVSIDREIKSEVTREHNRFNIIVNVPDEMPDAEDIKTTVRAIGDVLWPWGFRNGVRVFVKLLREVNAV
jgi:predicted RNA-binding protein YlqC (UPF0109 family)